MTTTVVGRLEIRTMTNKMIVAMGMDMATEEADTIDRNAYRLRSYII